MPDRFYTPEPLTIGEFTLAGPEAHHLGHVLRARPGTAIVLFNGDGHEYDATVTSVDKRTVTVHIHKSRKGDREREGQLIVAAAMPKGDRGDFLIEKLTELGVTRFVPLITERTVVVPKPARMASLRRTVIEASKQCGRAVLMTIEDPRKWLEFAASSLPKTRVILHPTGEAFSSIRGDAVYAIGPEGGFTEAEVSQHGWRLCSLGSRILRIETAALAVAAITSLAASPEQL